jgi:hypothetical protein
MSRRNHRGSSYCCISLAGAVWCISGTLDCSDEAALNYALWNVKAKQQLAIMDPFYFAVPSEAGVDRVLTRPAVAKCTSR